MTQFDSETAVDGPHPQPGAGGSDPSTIHWTSQLTAAWNINRNPNGGYAAASSLRAMVEVVPTHPDPITVTTHYLRPSLSDHAADIGVQLVRQGRRTSTLRSTMSQDGRVRLTSLATMSDLELWPAAERLVVAPPELPPPDECLDRSQLPQGVDLPILSRLDIRLDPAGIVPRVDPAPGARDRALMAGWIRFSDGREPTTLALPLFADSFPPSPMSLFGSVGWIPTVELTVQVRARPSSGWIRARFEARDIRDGMLIEDGLLWDSSGTLVAQSRQLALLLDPSG